MYTKYIRITTEKNAKLKIKRDKKELQLNFVLIFGPLHNIYTMCMQIFQSKNSKLEAHLMPTFKIMDPRST